MGNSQGTVYDANEVLIHSFLLDADHSMCSCPFVCTGQTVSDDLFSCPSEVTLLTRLTSLSRETSHHTWRPSSPTQRADGCWRFGLYDRPQSVMCCQDLNAILRRTHWSIKYNQCGPMMVMVLFMMAPFAWFMGMMFLNISDDSSVTPISPITGHS